MSQIKDYDTVIFDCDGVIIDINNFKTEAFGKSIEEYSPEVVQGFVNYCKQTFGVSRYVKFKDFFEIFAKKPFNEEEYNIFLSRYAKLCEKGYMIAPFTPGCLKLLEKLNLLDKKLYVASGSDEKELVEIFKKRNIFSYFNGIYGSPKTKIECTSNIINSDRLGKVLFIGDAYSDMKTAKEFNIDFMFMSQFTVQSNELNELCKKNACRTIDNLEQLL